MGLRRARLSPNPELKSWIVRVGDALPLCQHARYNCQGAWVRGAIFRVQIHRDHLMSYLTLGLLIFMAHEQAGPQTLLRVRKVMSARICLAYTPRHERQRVA